jgi:hypothetical protein
MTRYIILWIIDGETDAWLCEGYDDAHAKVRGYEDDYELSEVWELETGKNVTADFLKTPAYDPDGYADRWLKLRKEARAESEAA